MTMMRKYAAVAGLVGVAALGLSGCQKTLNAPKADNECYFIGHPANGETTFNAIAHNQPDLEHCAVFIYNARMDMLRTGTAGEVTEGVYNRNFLWATNTEVRMSLKYEGPRFPFLVKAGNKLVQPGSIVEEQPADSEPRTVELPKDLPEKNAEGQVVTSGQ
ncbi:MAG: hypothetical protein JF615_06080 [Asticcacaulis sp.]|nr:hypothetical protein [Asticcacaulis sp.]